MSGDASSRPPAAGTRTGQQFRATVGDATFDVEVTGDAATVRTAEAGRPASFIVTSLGRDEVDVRPDAAGDGTRIRATLATDGDVTWICIDGEVWTVEVEPAERVRRARTTAGSDSLTAPMPATVIRVLVEPGREVRRGETMILLEAMKMELPVRAPRDGRVTALHCKAGELVQPGVPLAEIE